MVLHNNTHKRKNNMKKTKHKKAKSNRPDTIGEYRKYV